MLKKCLMRKIMIYTIALVIVAILCLFPNNNQEEIMQVTHFIDAIKTPIYLINKDNYVVRCTMVVNSSDDISKIKELIDALTIDHDNAYIPSNFKKVIPKNTRVLNISLDEGLLKIDFSKEFLDIDKEIEEKMIEAIVYTLTEIPSVKGVMIFVEGKKLDYLEHSKVILPNVLDRNIGINKVYDITNIKDTSKTTIYYVGKENDLVYYVPVTKIDNKKDDKVEIIIEELKSSPIYATNLISYLASGVELLNYEELEKQITLSFNNEILANIKEDDILEEVKYSIALSLKDTLNMEEVIFKVNDKVIASFKEN